MVFEGQEKDDFWNVLGGKEEYASDKTLQVSTRMHEVKDLVRTITEQS
jgi:hypothetical protein